MAGRGRGGRQSEKSERVGPLPSPSPPPGSRPKFLGPKVSLNPRSPPWSLRGLFLAPPPTSEGRVSFLTPPCASSSLFPPSLSYCPSRTASSIFEPGGCRIHVGSRDSSWGSPTFTVSVGGGWSTPHGTPTRPGPPSLLYL